MKINNKISLDILSSKERGRYMQQKFEMLAWVLYVNETCSHKN